MSEQTKKCGTCGEEWSLDSFYLRKVSPNRYQKDCISCYKAKRRTRYLESKKDFKLPADFFESKCKEGTSYMELKGVYEKLKVAKRELFEAKCIKGMVKKEGEGAAKEVLRKKAKVYYLTKKAKLEKYWADYYARKAEEKEINDLL